MNLGPLLAAAVAHASPCIEWETCPVAAALHPVSWSYAQAYQSGLEEVMSGKHASPLFSPTLNEAEAHWRLLAATGRGLRLPSDTPSKWRDLALAGAFLSFNRVVDVTTARSDEAAALRTAADTMISPSAELVVPTNGRAAHLEHHTGGETRTQFERAEEEEALDPDEIPSFKQPHPPVRVGAAVGWKLRELDAPTTAPILTWDADLSVHNAGITLWRADLDLLHLHWDAAARERIFDGVSLGVGAHSADTGPEPERWSAGVYWNPRPNWVVSAQRSAPFDERSWRFDVALRVELGTFLPGRLDPSLAGVPSVVDTGPNLLVLPGASPSPGRPAFLLAPR